MNILLVEDEVFIRKSLKNIIERQSNHRVPAQAGNGLEALKILNDENIDVVLTDISMPVMDGIELLKEIKKQQHTCKVILLSCLSEMEYAINAVKHGASDYFLKIETEPEKIIERLDELEKEIESEKNKMKLLNSMQFELDHNRAAISDKFLNEILFGPDMQEEFIRKRIDELGINIGEKDIFLMIMALENAGCLSGNLSGTEKMTIDFSVMNIAAEMLAFAENGICFKTSFGNYVVLCNSSDGSCPGVLNEIYREINKIIFDAFAINTIKSDEIKCRSCSEIKSGFSAARESLRLENKDNISNPADEIKRYIDENFTSDISLADLSKKFCFNHCYVSIMLKEKLGENFIDYLTRLRIEKAKQLISKTPLSASEIGYLVGYQSPQYFSKIFSKTVGMSVTEYKKSVFKSDSVKLQ